MRAVRGNPPALISYGRQEVADKTYTTTERIYRERDGASPVYLYAKGAVIPWARAVELGLVKDEAKAKSMKADAVENKAVKPESTKRSKS